MPYNLPTPACKVDVGSFRVLAGLAHNNMVLHAASQSQLSVSTTVWAKQHLHVETAMTMTGNMNCRQKIMSRSNICRTMHRQQRTQHAQPQSVRPFGKPIQARLCNVTVCGHRTPKTAEQNKVPALLYIGTWPHAWGLRYLGQGCNLTSASMPAVASSSFSLIAIDTHNQALQANIKSREGL